jgi:hypothetical protein
VRFTAMLALFLAVSAAGAAEDSGIATYQATYRAEYKGKNVGTAQWSVVYHADGDTYEFNSQTRTKGLLKLVSPNPAIERSVFRVENGKIVPLEFWFEDGSRKGDDNFHLVFDWERNIAIASRTDGRHELATPAGTLDRGSLQVALMRDLALTGKVGRYRFADDDSVTEYIYDDEGETTTDTGIGKLTTRALKQHREGSSRTTYLFMAPELRFLPARIEQHRNGEVLTAFTLEEVSGMSPSK